MDNYSNVRKNIPISILKRRADAMRSGNSGHDDDDGIEFINEPTPPKPPSPTLLNQLRKLMDANKGGEGAPAAAPPPPIISKKTYEDVELSAPPPPSLSRRSPSSGRSAEDVPMSHQSQPRQAPAVVNLEPEASKPDYINQQPPPSMTHHPPPMHHPSYPPMSHMNHPPYHHMGGNQPSYDYPPPMYPHPMSGMGPPMGYGPYGGGPPTHPMYPSAPPQQMMGGMMSQQPPPAAAPQMIHNNGGLQQTAPPVPASGSGPEKEDSLQQLLTQRDVYLAKARSLNKDLDRLKEHKTELLSHNKRSAQTSAFVAENEKLQAFKCSSQLVAGIVNCAIHGLAIFTVPVFI
uniref:Uncharacterized protein n=1 Tax=Cacopsylla melanoneura TaxID=428564 RepID=A0A8D8SFM8_9HEMI